MIANASDRRKITAARHVLQLQDPSASEESVLAALAWLEEHEEHYQLAQEVSRFSLICDQVPSHFIAQASPSVSPLERQSWLGMPLKWAMAAAVGFFGVALAALIFHSGLLAPQPSRSSFEYFTGIGESKSVTLPDRSRIALGAASGVRVTYEEGLRRVKLTSGEAFFNVAKNSERPFIVETDEGEVTALGTAFNVHRAGDSTTVTLLRGLVKVETHHRNDGPVTILRPNSQVEIRRLGGLSDVRSIDGELAVAWRKGSYRYNGTPLATIISDLRRYYAKPIVLDSAALNNMRFTGVVNLTTADIEQWLAGLRHLGDIEVSIRPDMVIINRTAPPGGN